jgi:hypothetical protein
VSWYEVAAFAKWAGARLPKEAEWEYAARGTEGRKYPWGKEEPDVLRANYLRTGPRHVTPVGLYPSGATPEGVQDMAGNVWESIDDWHDEEQRMRVLRGGSWYANASSLRASSRRASYRGRGGPEVRVSDIGFPSGSGRFPLILFSFPLTAAKPRPEIFSLLQVALATAQACALVDGLLLDPMDPLPYGRGSEGFGCERGMNAKLRHECKIADQAIAKAFGRDCGMNTKSRSRDFSFGRNGWFLV